MNYDLDDTELRGPDWIGEQSRDELEDNRMTLRSMEMALECAKTPELIKGIEFQIKCLKSNISQLEGILS